jgi:hypothetical protein
MIVDLLFGVGAALLLGAGFLVRWRIRESTRRRVPEVTEETLRRIEEEGVLRNDDPGPLDEEAVREEEDRFWEESWDRPENLWE